MLGTIGKFIYKNRSVILMGIGIGTGIACVVEVGRKSAKNTPKIIEEHNRLIDEIHEEYPEKDIEENAELKKEYNKEVFAVYRGTAWRLFKNYAIGIGLGATSITCTLCGYGILRGQYAAMSSAYTVLEAKFKDYRNVIVESYGEQADFDAMQGITVQERENPKAALAKNDDWKEADIDFHEDVKVVIDDTWGQFSPVDPGYNLSQIYANLSMAQAKLDSGRVDALQVAELADMFGFPDATMADGLPLKAPYRWTMLGYEHGDTIKYDLEYDADLKKLNKNANIPITIVFRNAYPVLTKIKPNDSDALIAEDCYKGNQYNLMMEAAEKLG